MNLKMEQIIAAKNAEELIALAKAEGVELSEEKATAIFKRFHEMEGELSMDELEHVAGGKDDEEPEPEEVECPACGAKNPPLIAACTMCGAKLYTQDKC